MKQVESDVPYPLTLPYWLYSCSVFFLLISLSYFREREREQVHAYAGVEGQSEQETENLKQAPHSAQSPSWGLIPRP